MLAFAFPSVYRTIISVPQEHHNSCDKNLEFSIKFAFETILSITRMFARWIAFYVCRKPKKWWMFSLVLRVEQFSERIRNRSISNYISVENDASIENTLQFLPSENNVYAYAITTQRGCAREIQNVNGFWDNEIN